MADTRFTTWEEFYSFQKTREVANNLLTTINDIYAHVNLWQPSGRTSFKVIPSGAPFLFKLKSPLNAIGGIGFFSAHSILPLDVAWDIFGDRNGLTSFFDFKKKIVAYRNQKNTFTDNPNIGCIVLTDPIFFKKKDWIETPKNWSKSIVQGKSYDTNESIGAAIWAKVENTLEHYQLFERKESHKSQLILEPPSPKYGSKYLTKVRLGQGAFRVNITDAYKRRCAVSGEKTLPVLEAAHIKAYSESGPHHIANGLLLRADLHKLFDAGYMTITKERKVEISRKIKEVFENGKDYYKYHGKDLLILPEKEVNLPKIQYLTWHNEQVYNG